MHEGVVGITTSSCIKVTVCPPLPPGGRLGLVVATVLLLLFSFLFPLVLVSATGSRSYVPSLAGYARPSRVRARTKWHQTPDRRLTRRWR